MAAELCDSTTNLMDEWFWWSQLKAQLLDETQTIWRIVGLLLTYLVFERKSKEPDSKVGSTDHRHDI
jgi:hypothetical protein